MTKWSYNVELFFSLPDILQFTFSKIAKLAGINNQQLNRYKKKNIQMSLDVLIDMCNALNIPIRYFIVENDVAIIPGRGEAVVPAAKWKPIIYDREAADRFFGEGLGRIYWKDVGELMGLAPSNAKNRLKGDSRFPVDEFLAICTKLQISPYNFIIDENLPSDKNDESSPKHTNEKSSVTKLSKNVETMNRRLSALEQKFDNLLKAYKRLASLYSQNEPEMLSAADEDEEFSEGHAIP